MFPRYQSIFILLNILVIKSGDGVHVFGLWFSLQFQDQIPDQLLLQSFLLWWMVADVKLSDINRLIQLYFSFKTFKLTESKHRGRNRLSLTAALSPGKVKFIWTKPGVSVQESADLESGH